MPGLVLPLDLVVELRKHLKGTVGVTNGVFDLIHAGHADHFKECKNYCDWLIVLVNSDESVRAFGKGTNRPFLVERDRVELLSSVRYIDFIVVFQASTASDSIRGLRPDIYLKGSEPRPFLPEQEACDEVGAEIVYTSTKRDSTTQIVERICKQSEANFGAMKCPGG